MNFLKDAAKLSKQERIWVAAVINIYADRTVDEISVGLCDRELVLSLLNKIKDDKLSLHITKFARDILAKVCP